MALADVFQLAKTLNNDERKELVKLLLDLEEMPVESTDEDETWDEAELAELMKVEPKTGAEIVQLLKEIGTDPTLPDGAVWKDEQRRLREERERIKWSRD